MNRGNKQKLPEKVAALMSIMKGKLAQTILRSTLSSTRPNRRVEREKFVELPSEQRKLAVERSVR